MDLLKIHFYVKPYKYHLITVPTGNMVSWLNSKYLNPSYFVIINFCSLLMIQRSSRRPLRKHMLIIQKSSIYLEDSEKFKQAFRNDCIKHMNERKEKSKVNYFKHREERCDARRDRYVLTAPHDCPIKTSLDQLISKILSNPKIKHSLTMSFNVLFKDYVRTLDNKTTCELASRKLLHQVLLL